MTQGFTSILLVLLSVNVAWGQSSSMYKQAQDQHTQQEQAKKSQVETAVAPGSSSATQTGESLNPELEKTSLCAVPTKPATQFKVNDLIVVIVREEKEYESDAKTESKRSYQMDTQIDRLFKWVNGNLGEATFPDGKPEIGLDVKEDRKGEGDAERNDKLTFRLTCTIIDIKPNGILVLEGKKSIKVDGDEQQMTFTGSCRSADITADNSVLSSNVAEQVINVQHSGAVRDAAKRGWLAKMFDQVRPL
ncbi:MAG: Flagellar L-ring protein [Phycisphaerae bacterium]|nr:Flagellar L-ring protein [Phycisphaerae bacterium]